MHINSKAMAVSAPDEIKLMIFEQLMRAKDAADNWPGLLYDGRVARAPFIVAAVCRRWRELALAIPTLWTYFGFPSIFEKDERQLQRLNVLRHRAGAAPIDVVFGWNLREQTEACTGDVSLSIFNGILSLHLRWKTVVMHVMGSAECGWTMDPAFRCSQWPLLESLSLAIDGRHTLPAAPHLRRMWLDCHRESIEDPFVAEGYPRLTVLCIYCDSVSILRGLAPTVGTHLVELILLDDSHDFVDKLGLASTLGVFPALQCLTLDDVRWVHHIEASNFKKLVLTIRYIERVEPAALRRLHHVRELQLCGSFETRELALLKDLSNITTLTFASPHTLMTAFKYRRELRLINSLALRNLASLEPSIWPHLEHLHFGATIYIHLGQNEVAQDIVDFVAARKARSSILGEPTVARIVTVAVNHPGAPEWLEKRLRELVAE